MPKSCPAGSKAATEFGVLNPAGTLLKVIVWGVVASAAVITTVLPPFKAPGTAWPLKDLAPAKVRNDSLPFNVWL